MTGANGWRHSSNFARRSPGSSCSSVIPLHDLSPLPAPGTSLQSEKFPAGPPMRRVASERGLSGLSHVNYLLPTSASTDLPVLAGMKSVPHTRWHGYELCLAFIAGVLASCLIFTLGIRFGHLPPALEHPSLHPSQAPWMGVKVQNCPRAQGIALSPLALAAGNPGAVPDRLIVAARHLDDTSWLDVYLSDIPHIIYQVDDANKTVGARHATLANKGNEAMAYLQFIIDYYDRLPPSIVFLHGHRGTWHLRDHLPVLQRLRWGAVPFANLRYANSPGDRLDWECGNRTDLEEFQKFNCDWQGGHLFPGKIAPRKESDITVMNKDTFWDSLELEAVWNQTFAAEIGALPSELKAPCCAEFMVVRERILTHPREFYVHLRDWILETEIGRYRSGRVFEYMWHVIFGELPVMEAVPECVLLICDEDTLSTPIQTAVVTGDASAMLKRTTQPVEMNLRES